MFKIFTDANSRTFSKICNVNCCFSIVVGIMKRIWVEFNFEYATS